jgi:hypothetical protein
LVKLGIGKAKLVKIRICLPLTHRKPASYKIYPLGLEKRKKFSGSMQHFGISLVFIAGKNLKTLSGEVVMPKFAFNYRIVTNEPA